MKKINVWSIVLVLFLLASCASQKEVAYLQGTDNGYAQKGVENYEITIRPDDLIAIMVNSKDIELALMFNLPIVAYQMNGRTSGQNNVLGYLVDKEGQIDFPQLGKITIAGMNRNELTQYIKGELIAKGLINDPIVTVQFLNFRVSVLGEVVRPGTFDVTSERITLFEAISKAGDLTIYGTRHNVKIIRVINGVKTISVVDLRSPEILDSPFYYLQQNDIVYVEPNKAKSGQREINQNRSVGTFASIVSVALSAVSIILSVSNK